MSIILLSASMLSFVITLMGIKWWFRHRLTLDHPPQVESPVLLRPSSVTEIRENCARGVYRQSVDAESLLQYESPSRRSTTDTKAKTKSSKWLCLSSGCLIIHHILIAICYNLHLFNDRYASCLSLSLTTPMKNVLTSINALIIVNR